MTDTVSPFILLLTMQGLVSVDVRTIAGTLERRPWRRGGGRPEGHPVAFGSTVGDSSYLLFATATEADEAVKLLHAAREQHDDARAEDARAKVVGEAIRESAREVTRDFSDVVHELAEVRQLVTGAEELLAQVQRAEFVRHTPFTDDDVQRASAFGSLNAEAIIEYDRGREHPASEAIHACIRQIADKPHRAPLYLAALITVVEASIIPSEQVAELARSVDASTVKIGEPYQGPDGRWLMQLIGGSVLSFKDEPEARTFAAQREALWQSGKVATPPRCEIVCDVLRMRDTSGATECVLDLRDVSFVRRLADEYSDGTATVWIVLRVGETFKLDLPTVADYERVADHVAALRGPKPA